MTLELIEKTEDATLKVAASGKLPSDDYATFEPSVSRLIEDIQQAADRDDSKWRLLSPSP